MAGHTALILGDQLMRDNPALDGAARVLFVEATEPLRRLPVHRQRAHLVLSAMRHFSAELREQGHVEVVERRACSTFADGLRGEDDVVCTAPNSHGGRVALRRAGVRFVESAQFLTGPEAFAEWADGRRRLVMEDFYRRQRRRFDLLLDPDGEPEGGRWNLDRENRRPPRQGMDVPPAWRATEDAIDDEVRADLDALDVELWGADGPRTWPATPKEAQASLRHFVRHRLEGFGPWQDAMVPGERVVHHALLSAPLNLGLIDPLTVARAAERAYRRGDVPLQSAEGFVRQIIGWREYVWGMYWLRRERWPHANALRARRRLPAAYEDGATTGWNCLDTTMRGVHEDGYAHHIERLMVLGNIGLLHGVEPWQLVRWFQGRFVDGAEWVMAPNAAGMALFADGGEMMTKPYAAGGNYIDKMSGHCRDCRFSPRERTGDRGCPVTALYWDFVDRHRDRLSENRRTRFSVRTLERMDAGELEAIRARAADARSELDGRTGDPVTPEDA